jgi:cyanophycin synthetase
VVVAAPGDRRDEDIRAIATICAGRFDHYICRRDDGLRGRGPDEVPCMLRETLLANGVPADRAQMIPDEQEAIDAALRMGRPGDVVLIFVDAIARGWKQVTKFQPEAGMAPEKPRQAYVELPPAPEPVMVDVELVRDERGVRIARDLDD